MPWNWQLAQWPKFRFDLSQVALAEKQFLLEVGSSFAFLKNLGETDAHRYIVEILSMEGLESSRIEGEILDRESLQSSIRKQFGLDGHAEKEGAKESCMAKLLFSLYDTFDQTLTHKMLWEWHAILFKGQSHMTDYGRYRTHADPMQIVSNRHGSPKVFFEAPPSDRILQEMKAFIQWFNSADLSKSILGRAAISHVYFESIHPFEDGNGRIGRILVEKVLSQGVRGPLLIAVSKVLEKRKKEYYAQLEKCNRTLDVQDWLIFFADVVLQSQKESMQLLHFLIEKSKMMSSLTGQMNARQEKALLRMFAEGPNGFVGGLSAEKYISITKASKATATRDLNDLVQKKALVKSGELRHTRYWLNLG